MSWECQRSNCTHPPSRRGRRKTRTSFSRGCDDLNITLTAVFGGFEGESYADIPTVAKTVGLVPPETRAARTQEMKEIADFAKMLGCDVVALHLGFVPHDRESSDYRDVVAVTREVCDHCAGNGQDLHLETGQETADGLLQFIHDVERDNLFINFDPANMILYGTGEPIEALQKVGQYVHSVHCKDATWAANPGEEWGAEVPLGEGDVGMENYLRTLDELGYTGPLTIEREIPQEPERQKAEIGHAVSCCSEIESHQLSWKRSGRLFYQSSVLVGHDAAVGRFVAVDVVPRVLELDVATLAFVGLLDGHVGGQRDHGVAQRHFGMAARHVLRIGIANAPGPVLDLLGVAAADRAAGRGLATPVPAAPLACVSIVGRRLAVLDRHVGRRGRPGVEHHFLLVGQHQRALGPHDDLAVAAEAVAVDRRVGDDDLLVRILVVARDTLLGVGQVVDRVACSRPGNRDRIAGPGNSNMQ